jgi:DNA (cytosine-5)-methyltransferase 1
MVSVLGNYKYTFPEPIPLKLKLKDMLEDNVDEKYYLSDKMIDYITSKDDKYKVNENNLVINRDIACSKTTREGNTRADTSDYICRQFSENKNILKIKNANSKGYLEASEGDGVDISSRMEYHRGTVQKDKIQTLDTMGGESKGVVVSVDLKRGYSCEVKEEKESVDGVDIIGNYSKSNFVQTSIVNKNGSAPTFTENHGQVTAIVDKPLRIRKLTPKECFRLMGVKDEDYERCAKNQSDSSLYHLAGDSIVVNVLMAIFKEMIGSDSNE